MLCVQVEAGYWACIKYRDNEHNAANAKVSAGRPVYDRISYMFLMILQYSHPNQRIG